MAVKVVDICVATYRRPDSLIRLLTSLARQENAPAFEVIVVDNDLERSAESAVAGFSALPVTYLVEPRRGLARVRNRAVAVATAPFLAFIDDDEAASAAWLCELDNMARSKRADVVIGPVTVIFDQAVPEYIRTCSVFGENELTDGAALPWYLTRTSNAYVRRQSVPDMPAPFSTRFDLTGGEDIDLFKRMSDAGCSIVGAAKARAFEYREAHRATLGWVVRRALRNGGTLAGQADKPANFADWLSRNYRSGVVGARQTAATLVRWNRDRETAMRNLIRACEEVGKIMHNSGMTIEEYRRHS